MSLKTEPYAGDMWDRFIDFIDKREGIKHKNLLGDIEAYRRLFIVANMKESESLQTEWRPIETAPKDGRDLWLYVPKELPAQVVGYWDSDGFWQYREHLVADVAGELDSPSHWMPLPAPPSSSLILEREEAGGEIAEPHSVHLEVPSLAAENLSEAAGEGV